MEISPQQGSFYNKIAVARGTAIMQEDAKRYKTFPLRISPSLRQQANEFALSEGISLNNLINMAVAEKISRMGVKQHPQGSTNESEKLSLISSRDKRE